MNSVCDDPGAFRCGGDQIISRLRILRGIVFLFASFEGDDSLLARRSRGASEIGFLRTGDAGDLAARGTKLPQR